MTPFLGYAAWVLRASRKLAEAAKDDAEYQASIVRALITANREQAALLLSDAHEIARLKLEIARLEQDNALMVEAVTQYPAWSDRQRPVPRVH